jgi:hypothetical protein
MTMTQTRYVERFLWQFIRGLSIPVEVVKMNVILAYSTQDIDKLKLSLRGKHKCFVFTTAFDHLIHRETLLHDFLGNFGIFMARRQPARDPSLSAAKVGRWAGNR